MKMNVLKKTIIACLFAIIGWFAGAEELQVAYYKAGYIGPESSLDLRSTSNGAALEYTSQHGKWVLIIDENSPAGAQAWCADTVKYKGFFIDIVKIIIRRNFTLRPGVTNSLFDKVEIEVEAGCKLTLAKNESPSREMSLGAAIFSGEGEIDASNGVKLTTDIEVKGNVKVDLPEIIPVARVEGREFISLEAALQAAGKSGTIELLTDIGTISPIPTGLTDSSIWQGTLVVSGTMPAGFVPANYGNASSIIEFKGVSGGYLVLNGSFAGTLKLTNNGDVPAWRVGDGYGDNNFVFGALTGDGDLIDVRDGVRQQYSFKDASTFGGSITTSGKRFIIGEAVHGSKDAQTARIVVEEGRVVRVAEGKTLLGQWGVLIYGTVKGAGTLDSPGQKTIYFGCGLSGETIGEGATIDLSEGTPSIGSACTVKFADYLTLKNANIGDAVLKCSSAPDELRKVVLKNEAGEIEKDWVLVYADGAVRLSRSGPMRLYWRSQRGTFWEDYGEKDKNGNGGLARDENGVTQTIVSGDTIIFDKTHYTAENWNYDENLYIKQSVKPGTDNEYDLMILEGVTLKLGFCGASNVGQNVSENFKIYIEEGSTLELGYWGNTHHRDGLIRGNVTFDGGGKVVFGDDLGTCVYANGDIKGTATIDVNGHAFHVNGVVENPIIGIGTLSGEGTIENGVLLDNVTLDVTESESGIIFTDKVTILNKLTAKVTKLPEDDERIPIMIVNDVDITDMTMIALVKDDKVSPMVYVAELDDGVLYAKKDTSAAVTFLATSVEGYDARTFIVKVALSQPIEGVEISVFAADKYWTGCTDSTGIAKVLVGSADEYLVDGEYAWQVTVPELGVQEGAANIAAKSIAKVGEQEYASMQEAVEAANGGKITLLTNVFFAPPPGRYLIDTNGYEILITNDMLMSIEDDTVEIVAPEEIGHYVVFENEETPIVIDGAWLGAALKWKTKKQIQGALTQTGDGGLAPWQAYVLGFAADKAFDAKVQIAGAVQDTKADKVTLTDGLNLRPNTKTGVVVTRKIISSETQENFAEEQTTYDGETNLPEYDLSTMGEVRYLKLVYEFDLDRGQDEEELGL